MTDEMRTVHDSMGEMDVPNDALYGATTARAILNFPISGLVFDRSFLRAIGLVKSATAQVNGDLQFARKRQGRPDHESGS